MCVEHALVESFVRECVRTCVCKFVFVFVLFMPLTLSEFMRPVTRFAGTVLWFNDVLALINFILVSIPSVWITFLLHRKWFRAEDAAFAHADDG